MRLLRSIFLLLLLTLAACAQEPGPQVGPGTPIPDVPPGEVVELFLNAWHDGNYEAMYGAISPQSRQRYTLEDFQRRYEELVEVTRLEGLRYDLGEVTYQGATAAVAYDLRLDTGVFGDIEDSGRTMRLVQTPDGWQIAWSGMDIFDGLAAGAELDVQSSAPVRGNIYDRSGNLLVEDNGTKAVIYVAQQDMFGVEDCTDLLAYLMRRRRSEVAQSFIGYAPETIFYAGELDPDVYESYSGDIQEFCGSSRENERVIDRNTRRYVGQGAGAHVTGYLGQIPADEIQRWLNRGYQPDDLIGRAGVELAYESELRGVAERLLQIVEPGGVMLRELGGAQGSPSQSVTLTLDRDLQIAVAQAMYDAYAYAEPNWGSLSPGASAVVIDVNTGAILAMVSYPAFDPSIFNPDTYNPDVGTAITAAATDPRQPMLNRPVQSQYSPGSIFKIVTTAAAAAEGLIGPDEPFNCELEWNGAQFGDTAGVRYDWRHTDGLEPTGPITIDQALTSSCDPFYYQMGALLYRRDPNLLVEYARRMGLGGPTGIDVFTLEAGGNLAPPGSVAEAINNAIGQGNVQVTPLQIARLVAGIANGGTLYRPYIVERVGGVGGEEVTYQAEPTVAGEMGLSQEVLDIVREGMCNVTTDATYGTAEPIFRGTQYVACGKTGTAQTARREPNAWFAAYAPADNPQIAVVVMAEYSREGADVAAPIVRRIIDIFLDQPPIEYPEWWTQEYIPLNVPAGGVAGG